MINIIFRYYNNVLLVKRTGTTEFLAFYYVGIYNAYYYRMKRISRPYNKSTSSNFFAVKRMSA